MTLSLKRGKNEPYHRGFFCNDDNIKYPMVSAISQFWFQAPLRIIVLIQVYFKLEKKKSGSMN